MFSECQNLLYFIFLKIFDCGNVHAHVNVLCDCLKLALIADLLIFKNSMKNQAHRSVFVFWKKGSKPNNKIRENKKKP